MSPPVLADTPWHSPESVQAVDGAVGFALSQASASDNAWRRLYEQMFSFLSLQDDWDGADARAPDMHRIATACRLMKQLEARGITTPARVLPTPDGGILIEWHADGEYTEAEIVSASRIEWMQRSAGGAYVHWETVVAAAEDFDELVGSPSTGLACQPYLLSDTAA